MGVSLDEGHSEGSEMRVTRPSVYMRARHPDLFSDSSMEVEYSVSREVLSYHLETLTSQKGETAFENFAHRMCEKFIAPNLRPQTGPTGGGDGKTDAETYPVAAEIAIRWFGTDASRAGERKAFAFSAKKEWRSKIRSDVKSIAGTKRNYDHIYFVTNQFVPAKDAAAMQDGLEEKYGIPVIILDRTWLLDRVFDHNSLDIAVGELGVGKDSERVVKKIGPKDFERTGELEQLEKALSDGSAYDGQPGALAEDSLRSALLARGLERPPLEINARFERAVRIANDRGLRKHELAAIYDWAWTSYFWLEDYAQANALYDDVERLALDSEEAVDLERLSNLLAVIRTSVKAGVLAEADAQLDKRTANLMAALKRVSEENGRPNNALHARAMILTARISERAAKDQTDPMVDIWKDFREVTIQAHGLGTFPFQSIADTLTEVGAFIPESPEFDSLYETVTDALVARSSEGEAGKKNVERAYQKLRKGLHYEAIRWFGRGTHLLIKEEYESQLISALIGSGVAYEEAGLRWAARNFTLAALSQQFSSYRKTSSVNEINPAILQRYFWLELKLGRIPQIITAHELELIVRSASARTDQERNKLVEAERDNAGMLGALVLRTSFNDVAKLAQFPDALERLDLSPVKVALLFLMGREDTLREQGYVSSTETPEEYQEFFENWYAQGEDLGLPEQPDYALGETVVLHSRILGCDLNVTCSNNLTSVGIAEAVLGTLEALLATSLSHRMVPLLDRLNLRVSPANMEGTIPKLEFSDDGGEQVGTIKHPPNLTYKTRADILSFPNWIKDATLEIFLKFVAPADVHKWGDALFKDESALERALTFSDIPMMLGNLFGEKARLAITDWIEPDDPTYVIKRSDAWSPVTGNKARTLGEARLGTGEAPKGLFDFEKMKHSQVKVVSPIDVKQWDAARWDAVVFLFSQGSPPILGLGYKNRKPAQAIFEGLIKRLGQDDQKNDLRVAIIRGISRKNPNAYGVIIGPNLDNVELKSGNTFELVSRIHRMYPSTSKNLDSFLKEYQRQGSYLLIPVEFPSREAEPSPMFDYTIGKHHLVVRDAWKISENDPDAMALDLDDDPLIPPDQTNPPVKKVLERLRQFRRS